MEFCLGEPARRGMGATGSNPDKDSKSAWKLPPGFSLPRLPATSRGQDLYLLADHAKSEDIVNEREHLIIGKKILPQNGYHTELLCFAGNYPAPQKIFLKFDSEDASLPVTGDKPPVRFMLPNLPSAWFLFSSNYLVCGRETFDAIHSGGGDARISQPKTGIWMISLEQIDLEIARQKKAQQEQQAQSDAQAKQAAQTRLEKYDRNHNGIFDPDEREAALDNPAFIESELDGIDANHNGWLDAAELVYFDANQNRILEPKEQAGMEIAQHLLAQRLLKKSDANGDGWLDRREFNELVQARMDTSTPSRPGFSSPFPDENHDGHVDLGELETFLKQQTRSDLRSRRMPGADPFNQTRMDASQPVDPRQLFKEAVEFYWQNSGGKINRPAFINRIPMGTGFVPNQNQRGVTP